MAPKRKATDDKKPKKAKSGKPDLEQNGTLPQGNESTACGSVPDEVDPEMKCADDFDSLDRGPFSVKWVFTWQVNNSSEMEHLEQEKLLLKIFERYVYCFQLEKGAKSGKIHWQGYVRAEQRFRFLARWGKKCKGIFAKVAHGKDYHQAVYCTKDETSLGHRHCNITEEEPIVLPPHMALRPLRNWQQELLDKLETDPDSRRIIWIWSNKGNIGKSDICAEIEDCVPNSIVVTFKAWDAYAEIASVMKTKPNLRIVLVDCPRGESHRIDKEGMEAIKNGRFTLTKGAQKNRTRIIMKSPHLVVFANEYPCQNLSTDRWEIIEI